VDVDRSGNIYVVDMLNRRLQKFDPNGMLLTFWGSEGNGRGQFSCAYGVSVDFIGNVFVADTANHRIQVFGLPVAASPTTWSHMKSRYR
jgi:hypothetical protein